MMIRAFSLLTILLTTASLLAQTTPSLHRVMSCNILLDLPEQKTTHSWEARRPVCIEILRRYNPDIIGFQETNSTMTTQLAAALSAYEQFGLESPDIDHSPRRFQAIKNVIFYRRDRYRLVSGGTYWLSDTPHIAGSKAFGEGLARHVNWVRLEDRASRRQFRFLNTHLAANVPPARVEEAKIIAAEVAPYATSFPQIMAGDFNADIREPIHPILTEASWRDTYAEVHDAEKAEFSFHGLTGPAYAPQARKGKIDFIFARGPVKTTSSTIVHESINGVFPSDHYFVSADVSLEFPAPDGTDELSAPDGADEGRPG